MGTTITLSLPWEAWGTRGVHTRGHSGWVAILGGGARGGGLELEFQLEFDSHEVFEYGLGGLGGCPLKAVKFQSLGYAASNFTSDATRRGQTLECLN